MFQYVVEDEFGGILQTDLFDTATMERMAGHLQVLLAAIAADPDRPLGAVPLLTATERDRCWPSGTTPPGRCRPPRCASCSPPRPADTGRPGGDLRQRQITLRGAGHGGEPAGPPADRPRAGPERSWPWRCRARRRSSWRSWP